MVDPAYIVDQRELVTHYEQIRAAFRAARVTVSPTGSSSALAGVCMPAASLAHLPAVPGGGLFSALPMDDGSEGGAAD